MSVFRISQLMELRHPNYNQLVVRQKVVQESDSLQSIDHDPDHFGIIYSVETIRQGQPEPSRQLIADVYASEFRLHVIFLVNPS